VTSLRCGKADVRFCAADCLVADNSLSVGLPEQYPLMVLRILLPKKLWTIRTSKGDSEYRNSLVHKVRRVATFMLWLPARRFTVPSNGTTNRNVCTRTPSRHCVRGSTSESKGTVQKPKQPGSSGLAHTLRDVRLIGTLRSAISWQSIIAANAVSD